MIKITKADVRDGQIYISPNWVSNGMWAVKRDLIKNEAEFRNEDTIANFAETRYVRELTDDKMEGCLPKDYTLKVSFSGKILNSRYLDSKHDKVIFIDSNGENETLFDRRYITMLGLQEATLEGSSPKSSFTNKDKSILVMPTAK